MNYTEFRQMHKKAAVDAGTLDKARQLARLNAATSMPLTAPLGLLMAALTPAWQDSDVSNMADRKALSNLGNAFIPGKAWYDLSKLDKYKQQQEEQSGQAKQAAVPSDLDIAKMRDAIDKLPGADQIRQASKATRDKMIPVINDLRDKYQPLYDDFMGKIIGKLRKANWDKTNANAASIGAGGLTAMGTYGLTGLVPGLKKSTGLRLLLAAMTGGIAGAYTSGGLNDLAIKKQTGLLG